MAKVNKISSFKSFTEIKKQESVSKLREENNSKRQDSVGKIAAILDELGLTSFEGLEEDQKQAIISKIFGDVSEEEIAEIEVEVEDVTESVITEASLSGIEFGNDDGIHPTKHIPLTKSLKKNKVKMEVEKEEGDHGYPEVKLTGKRKDIEKVLADIWGPDSIDDHEDAYESLVTEKKGGFIAIYRVMGIDFKFGPLKTDDKKEIIAMLSNAIQGGFRLMDVIPADKVKESVVTEGSEKEDAKEIFDELMDVNGEEIADMDSQEAMTILSKRGIRGGKANKIAKELLKLTGAINEAIAVEGKRGAKKVFTAYRKIMDSMPGISQSRDNNLIKGCIKVLGMYALEDANFHREMACMNKIKGSISPVEIKVAGLANMPVKVSVNKIKDALQQVTSKISLAGDWTGIAIAEGTALFLDSIGATKDGQAMLDAFNSAFESTDNGIENMTVESLILEGTRGQFGKIDNKGNITSVYTHYDSYPDNMLPIIKKSFKGGKNVDTVLSKGANSGLDSDISKINFYGDGSVASNGNIKKIDLYLSSVSDDGAEYVYLWDEKSKKWMMADIYGKTGLVPAFESVVIESGEINEAAKLVDEETGKTVKLPYKTKDFRGDAITVKGFTEPHKSSSSGRIQTDQGEFFPGVAGVKIVGHKFESVVIESEEINEAKMFYLIGDKEVSRDEVLTYKYDNKDKPVAKNGWPKWLYTNTNYMTNKPLEWDSIKKDMKGLEKKYGKGNVVVGGATNGGGPYIEIYSKSQK